MFYNDFLLGAFMVDVTILRRMSHTSWQNYLDVSPRYLLLCVLGRNIFNYFVCVRMHMCESTPATHGGNVDSFQEYILYFFIVGPWCDSNYLYLQSHFSGSLLSFQRQQIRKKPFILCLYPVQCLPRAIHGRCLVN